LGKFFFAWHLIFYLTIKPSSWWAFDFPFYRVCSGIFFKRGAQPRGQFDFIYPYLNTKVRYGRDMESKEFPGDIYNVFSKIAKETGGTIMIASRATQH
jgi:hypothetical protein